MGRGWPALARRLVGAAELGHRYGEPAVAGHAWGVRQAFPHYSPSAGPEDPSSGPAEFFLTLARSVAPVSRRLSRASLPSGVSSSSSGALFSTGELAHEFGLRDHVAAHSRFQVLPGCARRQVERGIQGVEFEEIAMRFAGRRAGAAITDTAKIIAALAATAA